MNLMPQSGRGIRGPKNTIEFAGVPPKLPARSKVKFGMPCPNCKCMSTSVIDSRPVLETGAIRRRRVCQKCGLRFSTYETFQPDSAELVVDFQI